MAETDLIINAVHYPMVHSGDLPEGTRSYRRARREAQPGDGRVREAKWAVSGPIGLSREGADDGKLATDYVRNLTHEYDNLLTSSLARTALSLSSSDPTVGTAFLPRLLPFFTGGFSVGNVSHIVEDRSHILFARNQGLTQVNPASMAVVQTRAMGTTIEGLAVWRNRARVGLGAGTEAQTVDTIGAGGFTQSAISGKYFKDMAQGADRFWMVDAASGVENRITYTLDDMASFATSFVVGDESIPATGIGTVGPFAIYGNETGVYGFTQSGTPVRLVEGLRDFRSSNNGASSDSLWGWDYVATEIGLFAVDVERGIANPVGPGEGTRGRAFEGDVDGFPTAVKTWKDSVWVAYRTTAGDTYILRGVFSESQNTKGTGRPDWYVFRYASGVRCNAMSSTSERTNPTLLIAEAGNLAWYTLGRRGRDIGDSNVTYDTGGGTWYGSTMMRENGLRCVPRTWVFITENCNGTNTWQVAVSNDEGSYTNHGSAVTTNGRQVVRPVSGGAPISSLAFNTLKPRLTQVAASSSAPPQIRGDLTLTYDARPERIIDATAVIMLGQYRSLTQDLANLDGLDDAGTTQPVTVVLPDEITARYAHIEEIAIEDHAAETRRATVRIAAWDTS